jgi:hypothetical protein
MAQDIGREIEAQGKVLLDSVRKLQELYQDVQAEAVADAYRDIVETSPVLTGAYRSEHVIEQGDGEAILYESPNRAGPNQPFKPPTFFEPPLVEGRVEPTEPYARVQIANRRYYAGSLEYGSATNEPRHIYESAALRAEANLERIAERASSEKID